jgi:hypothetical protein
MARDRQLIGIMTGTAKRRGEGLIEANFLPRPGEIGATEGRRGPTFDVKSLKMYVKTSFFDIEHEVKKDSFFVSAGIDIFLKNNVHNNFFRNLTSKSSSSIFFSPRQSRVKEDHLRKLQQT